MPVKGSTAFQVQLQNFTSETKVEFLVTKFEITPCLWNFYVILTVFFQNELFRLELGKHYNCPQHNDVIKICFQLLQMITI